MADAHSLLTSGPGARAGLRPTRALLGLLLMGLALAGWVVLCALSLPWDVGEAPLGPFPYSVSRPPDWASAKTVEAYLERVSSHDARRHAQLLVVPVVTGLFTGVFLSLGFALRYAARQRSLGRAAARQQSARGLRNLGLAVILIAVGFALWLGASDLSGYFSAEGMRIQTEILERSVWQARRLGVTGACMTAAAAAAPFALVGGLLLTLARANSRRG